MAKVERRTKSCKFAGLSKRRKSSVYSPSEAEVKKANAAKDELFELAAEHRQAMLSAERRMMRMGELALKIQQRKWWLLLKRKDGKPYHSFDQLIQELKLDGMSYRSVYNAMDAAKQLSDMRPSTLETLGKSKCYELARVKREAPRQFRPVLRALLEKPEMSVREVKNIAATAIASPNPNPNGNGGPKERWVNMEFILRDSDAQVVKQALAVAQAMDPERHAESEYTLGRHLRRICDEFLLGGEQQQVWRNLDQAGAFSGAAFKLEA
ncbi:MAG: hypothetical protein L0387_31010 [Acidobacteria bacterium]|nr:hypothetical protein [Acidobacteriota bacterium]